MYLDKNKGIVTLMAEIQERDVILSKVTELIGEEIDEGCFVVYSELVRRALTKVTINLNGELYNGSYILSVVPGPGNTLKLVYLPPLPWNKYEHNKELFSITEKDVKSLIQSILVAITNLNPNEIKDAIAYSNL